MKLLLKSLNSSIATITVATVLLGCSENSEPSKSEEQKMKQAMDGKNFDPSKMSPEARQIMEQMNTKGGGGTPPPAGAGGPAPSGGKK